MNRRLARVSVALLFVVICRSTIEAQAPAQDPDPPATDVFDLVRKLRKKDAEPEAAWDYRKPMMAFAPVIGAKPSSGVLFGAAGNVAFYRGDPATTHISSAVASLTFSSKGQTAITNRFTMFARDDRWRLEADHRFQWTSLETDTLGTSADTRDGTETNYDFFRLHHTLYYRLRPNLFAGGGLYFDNHINVGPSEDDEAVWPESPYVNYSEENGLPLDAQASAGLSVDLLWDSRDSFINAAGGWLAKASYRTLFDGFLGGDSSWQRLNVDLRTYHPSQAAGATNWPSGCSPISWSEALRRISTCRRPHSIPTVVPRAATPRASSVASGSRTVRSSTAAR